MRRWPVYSSRIVFRIYKVFTVLCPFICPVIFPVSPAWVSVLQIPVSSAWITAWVSVWLSTGFLYYRYGSRPLPFFPGPALAFPGPGPASRRTPPSHPLRASAPPRYAIRIVDRNSNPLIYKDILFRVLTIISAHLACYLPGNPREIPNGQAGRGRMGYGGSVGWGSGKTLLADATQIYARVLFTELLGPRTEGCLVRVTQVQGQLEALGQVCQVSIGPSGWRSGPPAAFQEVGRG